MANVTVGNITGTGVTQVLPANKDLNYAVIINNNETEAFLSVGTNAVLGVGIMLTTKGSHYEITRDNYVAVEINAVGSAGYLNLTYQTW